MFLSDGLHVKNGMLVFSHIAGSMYVCTIQKFGVGKILKNIS